MGLLRDQLHRCWQAPIEAKGAVNPPVPTVRVSLNQDGSLARAGGNERVGRPAFSGRGELGEARREKVLAVAYSCRIPDLLPGLERPRRQFRSARSPRGALNVRARGRHATRHDAGRGGFRRSATGCPNRSSGEQQCVDARAIASGERRDGASSYISEKPNEPRSVRRWSSSHCALTALPMSHGPAHAIVYCRTVGVPVGCVVRPVAPVARAAVRRGGTPINRGGPVNRVGRR